MARSVFVKAQAAGWRGFRIVVLLVSVALAAWRIFCLAPDRLLVVHDCLDGEEVEVLRLFAQRTGGISLERMKSSVGKNWSAWLLGAKD